jgi:SET domain-containing protein
MKSVRLADVQLASPLMQTSFPVEVKSAGEKGVGVFATRDIKRGETCCWYDGVMCPDQYVAAFTSGAFGYAYDCTSAPGKLVLAGFRTEIRRGGCAQLCNDAAREYDENDLLYLKHINVMSRDVEGRVTFVAKKPIKKGQELLYSYGAYYWRMRRLREVDTQSSSLREVLHLWATQVTDGRLAPVQIEHACNAYSVLGEGLEHYRNRFQLAMFFLGLPTSESDS